MFTFEEVKELYSQADAPVLTLYLNVDAADRANQANTPGWQIEMRQMLDMAEKEVPPAQRQLFKDIRHRAEQLTMQVQRQAKSIVAFYGDGFERRYELPMPVENRVWFGKPQITTLMWAIDEFEPYLVVLLDQEKARFFTTFLGSMNFQDAVELDIDTDEWRKYTMMSSPAPAGAHGRHGATNGGAGQDEFDDRMREQFHRFYKSVVEMIPKMLEQNNSGRLILAGAEQSMHQIKNLLENKLAEKLVGLVPAQMFESPAELMSRILPVALDYERQQEVKLVQEVIDFAKARGRGALGEKDVRAALEQQRVELLILPYKEDQQIYTSDLPMQVFKSGGQVEFVRGEAAQLVNAEGGMAARLYYVL